MIISVSFSGTASPGNRKSAGKRGLSVAAWPGAGGNSPHNSGQDHHHKRTAAEKIQSSAPQPVRECPGGGSCHQGYYSHYQDIRTLCINGGIFKTFLMKIMLFLRKTYSKRSAASEAGPAVKTACIVMIRYGIIFSCLLQKNKCAVNVMICAALYHTIFLIWIGESG